MYLVYVTFPSIDDAKRISRALIEQRLAACANIFPAHQSMYWWEGKVEENDEITVIYKTKPVVFDAFKELCEEMHPYDVPCIVALPIHDGHKPFLGWVAEHTGDVVSDETGGQDAKRNWTL